MKILSPSLLPLRQKVQRAKRRARVLPFPVGVTMTTLGWMVEKQRFNRIFNGAI